MLAGTPTSGSDGDADADAAGGEADQRPDAEAEHENGEQQRACAERVEVGVRCVIGLRPGSSGRRAAYQRRLRDARKPLCITAESRDLRPTL